MLSAAGAEITISHNLQGEVECTVNTGTKAKSVAKRANLVLPNEKAKSTVVVQLVPNKKSSRSTNTCHSNG